MYKVITFLRIFSICVYQVFITQINTFVVYYVTFNYTHVSSFFVYQDFTYTKLSHVPRFFIHKGFMYTKILHGQRLCVSSFYTYRPIGLHVFNKNFQCKKNLLISSCIISFYVYQVFKTFIL